MDTAPYPYLGAMMAKQGYRTSLTTRIAVSSGAKTMNGATKEEARDGTRRHK